MKLMLTLVAALFLTLGTAQAQDGKVKPANEKREKVDKPQREVPEKVADMLNIAKQLDMTPEQKANFKETAKAYIKEYRGIRSSNGSNEDKLAKLKILNKKREENLKKIFTKEQYIKYKDLKGQTAIKGQKAQKNSF